MIVEVYQTVLLKAYSPGHPQQIECKIKISTQKHIVASILL